MPINIERMKALKKFYGDKKGTEIYYAMEALENKGNKVKHDKKNRGNPKAEHKKI